MIPIFQLLVDDESEIQAIALTDAPAIEEKFVAFNKQHKVYLNDERRIIISPLLIPNQLIYRKDEMGEYYLYADSSTIQKVAAKMVGKKIVINREHTSDVFDSVYLISLWFSDSVMGVSAPSYFDYLPDGTLYVMIKVENDAAWSAIKGGDFVGVSIEGMFSIQKVDEGAREGMPMAASELEKLFKI